MARVIASVYSLLARHKSTAADELLLDAARLGNDAERGAAVESLLHRATARGLSGLIELFADLPDALRRRLGESADVLTTAVSRCARSDDSATRVAAARFIAATRSPKLAYILGDLLRSPSPEVFEAACDAAEGLAAWVEESSLDLRENRLTDGPAAATFATLVDLRATLEETVARALETPRGQDSTALAAAASRLLDRRGGQLFESYKRAGARGWPLVTATLSRPSDAASAASLLACAARGTLRQELPEAIARVERAGVLDGLLRNTHWLADPSVASAVAAVTGGTWWSATALRHDLAGRVRPRAAAAEVATTEDPDDLQAAAHEVDVVASAADAAPARATVAAEIGCWLLTGAAAGGFQDDLLDILLDVMAGDADAKLSLLRSASAVGDGGPATLLARLAEDADERVARMAARALSRRASATAEATLLRRAATASEGLRQVIDRRVGGRSFDALWTRFDRLPAETRGAAGRSLLKLLPAARGRLRQHLLAGPAADRIRGLWVAGEVGAVVDLREAIYACCGHADAKVRSKATLCLGEIVKTVSDERAERQLERALEDGDARVRANAVEVLELTGRRDVLPLLRARGRLGRNRERANALKATHAMGLGEVEPPLFDMLRDGRDPHRLSAVWAVEQTGQWRLLDEVVRLARADANARVRRSALATVRRMAEQMRRPAKATLAPAA